MAKQFGEYLCSRQLPYRRCPAERRQQHGVEADGDEDTERDTLPQFNFWKDFSNCAVQQGKHDRKHVVDARNAPVDGMSGEVIDRFLSVDAHIDQHVLRWNTPIKRARRERDFSAPFHEAGNVATDEACHHGGTEATMSRKGGSEPILHDVSPLLE